MKTFIAILSTGFFAAAAAEELSVSLVPERPLGSRKPAHLQFREVVWSTDSPWFHKPAPVCKVVIKPLDLSLVKQEAQRRGFVREELEPGRHGSNEPGAISYASTKPPWVAGGGFPISRYIFFGVAKFDEFERDEHKMAVVKPLATKEESVAICREWMKKLGIDESEFYRQGDWPEGFEVNESTGRVSRTHPITKEKVIAHFGQQLRFVQQIGGLPAYWSGFGGNIMFFIGDGGEFCGLNGAMRAWEKIGDYEVLDRAEVEAAVKEGFAWVFDPINCERVEVIEVELDAFHSDWDAPQVDFPLIFSLRCKLHGGPDNGLEKVISLPALKQHRDKYPSLEELARKAEREAVREEAKPDPFEMDPSESPH
ncbi:hypothetical protein [Haloferula sp.]|uniref:hypothetical protein n=1 Tax=Haloferula sp. TaxID=2497595 RepID=UPI003C729FA1